MKLASAILLLACLAGCLPSAASPSVPTTGGGDVSPPPTPAATFTRFVLSPTFTRLPPISTPPPTPVPTLAPTPDPRLPCGGVMPERTYLFLSCDDLRRIRRELASGQPEMQQAWRETLDMIDQYAANFPTTIDVNNAWGTLIWMGGDYPARDLALAYLVTGDPRYADLVVRLLALVRRSIYTDIYRDSETRGLFSRPSYGEVLYQSVMFAYLAVRDTFLTEDQRRDYDQFFLGQAALLEKFSMINGIIPLTSWLNRNIRIGANVASATIALALPGLPGAADLYKRDRQRLDGQMAAYWYSDGGWGEATDSYSNRVLEGLVLLAETVLRATGEDLYKVPFGKVTFQTLCNFQLKVMTPEGIGPAMNDAGFWNLDPGMLNECALRSGDSGLYFAAQKAAWGFYHAFESNWPKGFTLFNYLVWPKPAAGPAAPPAFTSLVLPATGMAILRSGWDTSDAYLALQYTASIVHQEQSTAAVYLYDRGPWIVGNGYFPDTGVARPTDQQSTLALDRQSQRTVGGKLTLFADLRTAAAMSITASPYPALTHSRTVLWYPAWRQWLVVDDALLADQPQAHSLQMRWYVRGSYAQPPADSPLWVFSHAANDQKLAVNLLPGLPAHYLPIQRQYIGDFPGNAIGVEMDVVPRQLLTRLVTSLSASSGQPPDALSVARSDSEKGSLITTQKGNDTLDWWLAKGDSPQDAPGDIQVNGRAACVRRRGADLRAYCLFAGAALDWKQIPLLSAVQPVSLSVDFDLGQVSFSNQASQAVSLYWPPPVAAVSDSQGRPFSWSQDGAVLTFQLPGGDGVLAVK